MIIRDATEADIDAIARLLADDRLGRGREAAGDAAYARAFFAPDARLAGGMIQQDAARIPELNRQIKALEEQMAHIAENSSIASQ